MDGQISSSLNKAGVNDDRARYFENRLKQGHALAVAKCDSEEVNEVADLMRSHGAVDVETF